MAINVVVHGVMGKMGQQVLDTVTHTLRDAARRRGGHHCEPGDDCAA